MHGHRSGFDGRGVPRIGLSDFVAPRFLEGLRGLLRTGSSTLHDLLAEDP